jgi:hypothetical protein
VPKGKMIKMFNKRMQMAQQQPMQQPIQGEMPNEPQM